MRKKDRLKKILLNSYVKNSGWQHVEASAEVKTHNRLTEAFFKKFTARNGREPTTQEFAQFCTNVHDHVGEEKRIPPTLEDYETAIQETIDEGYNVWTKEEVNERREKKLNTLRM